MKPKSVATVLTVGVGALVLHLIIVLALTKNWPSALANKISLAQLGSYGDSIAPFTAFFAVLAAVFSGLAFKTQQDALDQQRQADRAQHERDESNRFDCNFFRAIAEYDAAVERLDRASRVPSRHSTGQGLLREIREKVSRGDMGTDPPKDYWHRTLNEPRYQPVFRYITTVYSIVTWLDAAAGGRDAQVWSKLFRSRLSGPERFAIATLIRQHAKTTVAQAEQRLKLFVHNDLDAKTSERYDDDR